MFISLGILYDNKEFFAQIFHHQMFTDREPAVKISILVTVHKAHLHHEPKILNDGFIRMSEEKKLSRRFDPISNF